VSDGALPLPPLLRRNRAFRRFWSGQTVSLLGDQVTYRHAAGGWRRLRSSRFAGTYFWKTLTGPRALCRFELASAGHAHVTVQLLQSPALGCGRSQTLALR
jgi:hypothetical protein